MLKNMLDFIVVKNGNLKSIFIRNLQPLAPHSPDIKAFIHFIICFSNRTTISDSLPRDLSQKQT